MKHAMEVKQWHDDPETKAIIIKASHMLEDAYKRRHKAVPVSDDLRWERGRTLNRSHSSAVCDIW